MVWVPGFGSGVFGKFDPEHGGVDRPIRFPTTINQIPYALNVAPDGMVWVCGTGNDTLYRFNPGDGVSRRVFGCHARVSYTREIEFDKDGNIWTSNERAGAAHGERLQAPSSSWRFPTVSRNPVA